jgi:hypothetical protein
MPNVLRASLAAVALLAALPAAARADGSYPGESLQLALSGPSTAGALTTITASGQDLDAASYAGGFNLYAYAKDPAVDPNCAPSYWQENTTYTNLVGTGAETLIDVGDWEGADSTPFSLPVKTVFKTPGPRLICAYSTWVTDTAAAATLAVNVAGAAAVPAPTPQPSAPVVARPAVTRAPSVARSGRRLTCSPGAWTGSPTFSFAWQRGGRTIAHGRRLTLTRGLRHHSVACRVTATNAGGSATRLSPRVRVH